MKSFFKLLNSIYVIIIFMLLCHFIFKQYPIEKIQLALTFFILSIILSIGTFIKED